MPVQIGPWTIGPPDQPQQQPGAYDPSQPIGGAAPPAAAAPAQAGSHADTLAYLAKQYGGAPVAPPVPAQVKDINGVARPDPNNLIYTFPDGTTATVGSNGELGPIVPGKKETNVPANIPTNTTDPKIVLRNPQTGQITTVDNPNYKPPTGTAVAANTTDPKLVTRNPDGTITTVDNPNYRAPLPTQIAGNTTEPTILTRDPTTGAITQQPNPNYRAPAAAPIATNTTDPTIVMRDPTSGQITTIKNPNYIPPTATVVGAPGTTEPNILFRDPTTGQVSSQPNPNYVAPKPTQMTPSTTAPFISTMDAKGNVVNTPNPNYLPTDPGRMQAQLESQANDQYQALQQQVAQGKLTSDQAASQFDQWWNTNAEPIKQDIAQARATQQQALAVQQAQTGLYQAQAANIPAQLAQTGSEAAQRNVISMLPYVGGQGYGQAVGQLMSSLGTGKFPTINPQALASAATYSLPNLQEIGRIGAAQALANFSPTAQAHLATPGPLAQPPVAGLPQLPDLLNRGAYNFGGGAAGTAMPTAAAAPTAGAPPPSGLPPWMGAGGGMPSGAGLPPWMGGGDTAPVQPGTYGPLVASAIPWGQYTPGG